MPPAAAAACGRCGAETRRVELSWALTRQAPRAMAEEAAAMVARHGFRDPQGQRRPGLRRRYRRHARDPLGRRRGRPPLCRCQRRLPAPAALDYARAMADAGAVMVEDPCALVPDAGFRRAAAGQPGPAAGGLRLHVVARRRLVHRARGAGRSASSPDGSGSSTRAPWSSWRASPGAHRWSGLMGESALGTLAAPAIRGRAAAPDPARGAHAGSWR